MNSKRRLLILSCSQRKHETQELLPAIERYNGPLFFVVRRFLRECPCQARQLDVYILSASYGLIPGDFPIKWYDRRMDLPRAVELQSQVNSALSDILQNNYTSICFVLGQTYLKAFESAHDFIPVHTERIIAHGWIGKKLTQLKQWLWGEQPLIHLERNLNEVGSY